MSWNISMINGFCLIMNTQDHWNNNTSKVNGTTPIASPPIITVSGARENTQWNFMINTLVYSIDSILFTVRVISTYSRKLNSPLWWKELTILMEFMLIRFPYSHDICAFAVMYYKMPSHSHDRIIVKFK